MIDRDSNHSLSRRQLLTAGAGTVLITSLPLSARATPDDLAASRIALFGDRPVQDGRVTLDLPPIAENGYSVPIEVIVDSPMTQADHVKTIAILSPRNPVPDLVHFHLGPRAGRAHVSSRVRLAGTQTVQAIAEMSDGTLWSASREVVVTLAACVVL